MLVIILIAISGLVVGFLVGWFAGVKEGKKDVEWLPDKFKSVASDVFQSNSGNFKDLVDNVKNSVDSLTGKINNFEKERSGQFSTIRDNVDKVLAAGTKMYDAAHTLETALSSSGAVKGNWGEKTLKNILEDSNMKEGVDFTAQETIAGDGTALRPDFIVKLPGGDGLSLAIDAKASLDDYLRAIKEEELEHQKEHIGKFVSTLQSRIKKLSNKEYQKYLDDKIPYVVMFIPSEAAIRAAFDYDSELFKVAQESKVVLASPTTMMPLILLIAHAWRQYRATLHAKELTDEFADFGNRLKTFFDHISGVGLNLEQTTEKFNAAVGSFDKMVRPKIEKINELGGNIQGAEDIKRIEEMPRRTKKK
jgi:DNA recombination protein RmuC